MTLGGLLVFRGVVWVAQRRDDRRPDDAASPLLGGGPAGLARRNVSWVLGIVVCVAVVCVLVNGRRQRRRFGFPVRPMWAEVLLGILGCGFVLGAGLRREQLPLAGGPRDQFAKARGITEPPGGLQIEAGIPWPLVIVIGVAIVMTFLATRRRFGRYVFAYGGNPDAAELAGINTRWTIMKTFILMGVLCAISAAIASARLNGGTLDLGQGYELYVIAAAVIGGTSFAGGIGTIPGAILGALVLQSLAYGLSFMGFDSPIQNIVAGDRAGVAVGLDSLQPAAGHDNAGGGTPMTATALRWSRCATSTSPSAACTPCAT